MSTTIRERQAMVRDFMRKFSEKFADEPGHSDENQVAFWIACVLEEVIELAAAAGVALFLFTREDGDRLINIGAAESRTICRPTGEEINLVEAVDALRDTEYSLHALELILGVHDVSDDTFHEVHQTNMEKSPTRDEKGKVTKPNGWKPPDIATILRKSYPGKMLLFRK
jgi:predicted HAD superfamily Cof-like phosphohydrolase